MNLIKIIKEKLALTPSGTLTANNTIPAEEILFSLDSQEGEFKSGMKIYEELGENDQWNYLEKQLTPLARRYNGKFIIKNEDDELILNLKYHNYPARIQMDFWDPEPDVFIKFKNRTGTLRLYYDSEVKPDTETDEWSDEKEKIYFISDGLYFEEYPAEYESMKAVSDNLTEEFKSQLAEGMEELDIGYFEIDAGIIECDIDTYLPDLKNASEYFEKVFHLMSTAADIFSRGDSDIEELASIYIGGIAVKPGAKMVNCPYCSSTVVIGSDHNCPNCGGNIIL